MANLFSGNSAQITPFNFGAHAVRVIVRAGEPWFVASDVCAALDYKNTSQAVGDHLDADERYIETIDRGGSLLLINESGLYALVLRSRKPEARKFAKWVTGEVLPSIRKTGGYGAPALPRLEFRPPPALGTSSQRDPHNRYPRDGRTIESAKAIVTEIGCWANCLPPQARQDLQAATDALYDLLVSGWTEVDEALGRMQTAMHYLNRWQGRGGHVGNVSSAPAVQGAR